MWPQVVEHESRVAHGTVAVPRQAGHPGAYGVTANAYGERNVRTGLRPSRARHRSLDVRLHAELVHRHGNTGFVDGDDERRARGQSHRCKRCGRCQAAHVHAPDRYAPSQPGRQLRLRLRLWLGPGRRRWRRRRRGRSRRRACRRACRRGRLCRRRRGIAQGGSRARPGEHGSRQEPGDTDAEEDDGYGDPAHGAQCSPGYGALGRSRDA